MTRSGGTLVLASIHRHWEFSPRKFRSANATETTKPIIVPKAVHICHIIVKAPRMVFGADSAAYTGVVDDFAPTANPRAKRANRRFHQLEGVSLIWLTTAEQIEENSRVSSRHPKPRSKGDEARYENTAPTTEKFVQRRVGPTPYKSRAEMWRSIQKAGLPHIFDFKFPQIV